MHNDPNIREDVKFSSITVKDTGEVVDYVAQVPGFPRYFVSADGRVFRREIDEAKGYFEVTPSTAANGYLVVRISNGTTSRIEYVHRLVAKAFLKPPPGPDYQIDHRFGEKLNNHLANLRWVTAAENNSARTWQKQVRTDLEAYRCSQEPSA